MTAARLFAATSTVACAQRIQVGLSPTASLCWSREGHSQREVETQGGVYMFLSRRLVRSPHGPHFFLRSGPKAACAANYRGTNIPADGSIGPWLSEDGR